MKAIKLALLFTASFCAGQAQAAETVPLKPGSQTILVRAYWPEGPCEIDGNRSFQASAYGAAARFPEKLVSLEARFHDNGEDGWQFVQIVGATANGSVKVEFSTPIASAHALKAEWEASEKPAIFWISENKKCIDRKWMHLVRGLRVSRK